MLMPAVTAFVASFFADEIADEVEREHYPADPPGVALPLWRAILEGGKTALLAVLVYLCRGAVPAVRRLGRRDLLSRPRPGCSAANISSSPPCAFGRPTRRRRCASARGTVFVGGLLIAAFVSIPIVNLATPLFAMALMVHVHKRLGGPRLIAS